MAGCLLPGSVAWCEPPPPKVKRVLVLMAMKQEASPFLAAHDLQPSTPSWPSRLPMQAYTGRLGGADVTVVWAGHDVKYACNNVGTTSAAVSAYASILEFQPDVVISAGTAGGFRQAFLATF